ncbi:hypothetical protein BDZ90DRAFT_261979 [Jaminaea rosea]|uniref:ZZ-type domain-containing protein n=1 Tax=Jaminaea rosea TaxID=1569628 RepID=A0A316URL4_9BASI|nr:hypothetical protein BDZ90DRAFT_261979 [Jaminaea rosea]PWN25775.1 hypothetical protein BDZ90DRAFT_261979 [Jaminaea rosea]
MTDRSVKGGSSSGEDGTVQASSSSGIAPLLPPTPPGVSPLRLLIIHIDHGGLLHRLTLPPTRPSSLSSEELRTHIGQRLSIPRHEFDIEWVDDDNNLSYIIDDDSLQEAFEFFMPSRSDGCLQDEVGAAKASACSSSSSSSSVASSTGPPIELQLRIRLCTRISLSDSSGPSESGKSTSSASSTSSSWWNVNNEEDSAFNDLNQASSQASDAGEGGQTWEHVRRGGARGDGRSPSKTSSSSAASSSRLPPLNGRQRMAEYTGRHDDESDEEEEGTEYAYSLEGSSIAASLLPSNSSSATHLGIRCIVCDAMPIQGPRYLCLVCPHGISFCGRCEDTGRAIQHGPHLATHPLVKLVVAGSNGETGRSSPSTNNEAIASTLVKAAQQLSIGRGTGQVAAAAAASSADSQSSLALLPSATHSSLPLAHDVLCSFCSEPIVGARYLCANCPLDLPTPEDSVTPTGAAPASSNGCTEESSLLSQSSPSSPPPVLILTPHEGFNLCSSCEQHSLSVHDPDHFFIRIPSLAIAPSADGQGSVTARSAPLPLRLNPYLTIQHRTEGLLPTLYRSDDLGWEEAKRAMLQGGGDAATPGQRCVLRSYANNAAMALGRLAQTAESNGGSSGEDAEAARANRNRLFGRWRSTSSISSSGSSSTSPATPTGGLARPRSVSPSLALHHESAYVSSLIHPNIFCDVCFNVVEGSWLRCTSCVSSYDVCQDCARRGIAFEQHHRSHAFAVFKRSVDLDLFRSLVDHAARLEIGAEAGDGEAGGGESWPGQAMLPFPLV